MFGRIRVVALLLVPVLLIAASCKAKVYRTEEFGIELPIPKGVLSCPNPPGVHDHGPVLLLGSVRRNSCTNFSDNERIRYIEVFAEYNVAQDTLYLQDFLKRQCTGITKKPCGKPPYGLELPGLTSLAGRVDHPDGWTDIIVVTEAGKPAPDVDPTVPSMHYTITLLTARKHFQRDLAVFRKVLKTIRINPQ
jgi:hypothetical protein